MERKTELKTAKKIMGKNFIGPEELKKICSNFGILDPFFVKKTIPKTPFNADYLKKMSKDCILILGIPKDGRGQKLTINRMREILGCNPQESEPCFYNQDWYLRESFAKEEILDFKWYLIKKEVDKKSRGKNPEMIIKSLRKGEGFPSVVLAAFTFFCYYFLTGGEILWKNDFIWCSDRDSNGDRIYVGRYIDPRKINKNGFNVHRHLSLRPCYGSISQIKI